MTGWCLLILLAGGAGESGAWSPPRNPDPSKILEEARADADGRRFTVALAKLEWFHRNALKYQSSLAGVRLSFALSQWLELAESYPPARKALEKARDEARDAVVRRENSFHSFHDFVAINRTMGEESRTRDEFATLDLEDPALASTLFDLARPALVRAKDYALCGKYLRPEETFSLALQSYRLGRQWVDEGRFGGDHGQFVSQAFTYEIATLIALLVVNGRDEEARRLAHRARAEWDDAAFRAAVDAALQGTVPDPWP